MLESKLAHAKSGQSLDVLPHKRLAIDEASCHNARCSHCQRGGRLKELFERRRCRAHQAAIDAVIEVMPRITSVRQTCVSQFPRKVASKQAAIREAGDFVEEPFAAANDVEHCVCPQQRLPAARDHQSSRSTVAGKFKVAFKIEQTPIDGVVSQGTQRRLRKAKWARTIARLPHRQYAASQAATGTPFRRLSQIANLYNRGSAHDGS